LAAAGYLLYENWAGIKTWLADTWAAFDAWFEGWNNWGTGVVDSVVTAITGAAGALYDAGVNLIQQLWDGAKARFEAFKAWGRGLVSFLPDWMKPGSGASITDGARPVTGGKILQMPSGRGPAAAAPLQVGGQVTIKVDGPGQVTSVQSANKAAPLIAVDRGPTKSGMVY
jgi:hypothetical protein